MKYREIIEKISKDLLLDLASLRVWLIIVAYLFNFFVVWLTAFHGLHASIAHSSIGLLATIYYHFYKSKAAENAAKAVDSDPPTPRDPDAIQP